MRICDCWCPCAVPLERGKLGLCDLCEDGIHGGDPRRDRRGHDENGLDCWCEPYVAYEDEDARVIVHHHWVGGEVRDEEAN